MILVSSDNKRIVDIGASDNWTCFSSTILVRLGEKKDWSKAIDFLKVGMCNGAQGYETARQFNLIRDKLSQLKPDKIIYDANDKNKIAPWGDNISPVITSCGNFFTTADGKDLIFEIVSILSYAQIMNVQITLMD